MGRFAATATIVIVTTALIGTAGSGSGAANAAPAARTAAQERGVGAQPAGCARHRGARQAHCYLSLETAVTPSTATPADGCPVDEAGGYTACNLQSAYGLTKVSAKGGKHSTVAIVDPMDDPNAESDLAVYRSTAGLPACTTANHCFEKVNQHGVAGSYPAPDQNSAFEMSLDLDMVSAICPNCHIVLVEADSYALGDLGISDNTAVALGAKVVSNSWGTGEFAQESMLDGYFYDRPGVAFTFSSGDGAYQGGVQYPSASPYVTSVGGTELTPAADKRTWTETAWVTPGKPVVQGAGSGCSAYETKPPWQTDTGCANRMTSDVSAVAANVQVYDTYPSGGWFYAFGTSVSAPIVAGIYGLENNPASIVVPASVSYAAPAKDFYDITKGKTGTCTPSYFCRAAKGYDGPTGLGSPHGIGAFVVPATPLPAISGVSSSGPTSNPTITVTGSGFGATAPMGYPETCQSGDTGDNYGDTGLSFHDATQAWTAGQDADCIGLVVLSWSDTQVTYQFGNEYANYSPVATGDSVTVQVQGATFSGSLS